MSFRCRSCSCAKQDGKRDNKQTNKKQTTHLYLSCSPSLCLFCSLSLSFALFSSLLFALMIDYAPHYRSDSLLIFFFIYFLFLFCDGSFPFSQISRALTRRLRALFADLHKILVECYGGDRADDVHAIELLFSKA